jgi:hypothetical protein
MKFWTIQTKDVVEHILENGVYQPNFDRSRYLQANESLAVLYSVILQSFNEINHTDLPGVVFSFAKNDNNTIYSIDSIEEFEEFIKNKRNVLGSYWLHLDKENSVILELDYEDYSFNPIFIDLNDFQFLMPPFMVLPPYTEDSAARIVDNILQGRISISEFPSYVIQAHLPYIEKSNVVNIYPVFDLGDAPRS